METIFVLNLISWTWWRIYKLPFSIVYACLVHGWVPLYDKITKGKGILIIGSCYAFVYLLLALCVMHVWWLYLLLRIAYKLVAAPEKEGHEAGRDEYEGDSEDETEERDGDAKKEQ